MVDLLFVCEGNVCRSPFAEAVLRSMIRSEGKWPRIIVGSAGMRPLTEAPIDEETAKLVRDLGGDDEHRARRLDPQELLSSTLILTATRDQRHRIVTSHPRAIRSTYTLRQFARVLSSAPDEVAAASREATQSSRLAALVVGYHAALAGVSFLENDLADDDVVDPHGHAHNLHVKAASQILPALNLIGEGIGLRKIEIPEEMKLGPTRRYSPRWRLRRSA